MKIKDLTISWGPTLKIGSGYVKASVSITLLNPDQKALQDAREFLQEQYLHALSQELRMVRLLDGKAVLEAKRLIKKLKGETVDDAEYYAKRKSHEEKS